MHPIDSISSFISSHGYAELYPRGILSQWILYLLIYLLEDKWYLRALKIQIAKNYQNMEKRLYLALDMRSASGIKQLEQNYDQLKN